MYKKRSNSVSTKVLVLIVALTLVVGVTAGGTLAWLLDKTDEVKNTFTTSNVDITLAETTTSYQMIPGHKIAKDPKVTVKANSEKCYVFVKLVKSTNYDTYLANYEMAEGWTALTDNTGVYYRTVNASTADQPFQVLKGDSEGAFKDGYVTVLNTVTNAMMKEAATSNPTLTITAYASQYYKNNTATGDDANGTPFTVEEAWKNVTATGVTQYEPNTANP